MRRAAGRLWMLCFALMIFHVAAYKGSKSLRKRKGFKRAVKNETEISMVPRGTYGFPGTCDCYEHEPKLFGWRYMGGVCVCRPVCLYESNIVIFGRRCSKAPEGEPGGNLSPVKCVNLTSFRTAFRRSTSEFREYGLIRTKQKWLQTRKNVKWLNGTTALSMLDPSSTNVYHLFSKVLPWTWLNNITGTGGLPHSISRLLVRRSKLFRRKLKKSGDKSEHSVILQALYNQFSATKQSDRSMPLIFEWNSLVQSASVTSPLCMDQAVFLGCVRGALHQDGPGKANKLKSFVKQFLEIPEEKASNSNSNSNFQSWSSWKRWSKWSESTESSKLKKMETNTDLESKKPNLLYVKRSTDHKRAFSRISENKLANLFSKQNVTTWTVDFDQMSFKAQFKAVQWADIILGLHGANLLNPSLFMREGTIMIELYPWNFLWMGYGNSTMTTGGVYIGYMIDRRPTQPLSRLSLSRCSRNRECTRKYRDLQNIVLSNDDFEMIQILLSRAEKLSKDVMRMRWEVEGANWKDFEKLTNNHFSSCLEYDVNKKMAWVGYMRTNPLSIEVCALNVSSIEKRGVLQRSSFVRQFW